MEDAAIEGVAILGIYLGFACHAFYEKYGKSTPLEEEVITDNNGSVMIYSLRIFGACSLMFILSIFMFYGIVSGSILENSISVVTLLFFGLGGALFHQAAIARAKDAGKSRGFALLAVVPLANLALFVTKPKESPTRPPYNPENGAMRLVVGLAALIGVGALQAFDDKIIENIASSYVDNKIANDFSEAFSDLPRRLDSLTVLESLEIYKNRKKAYLNYRIELSEYDKDRLVSFIHKEIGPNFYSSDCSDGAIIEFGWTMIYRYIDQNNKLITDVEVDKSSCAQR